MAVTQRKPIVTPETETTETAETLEQMGQRLMLLRADLVSARERAEAQAQLLAIEEARVRRTEPFITKADQVLLTRLRAETEEAAQAIPETEHAIATLETRIEQVRIETMQRLREQAIATYTPCVERLGTAVRQLLDAIHAEEEARDTLDALGAMKYVTPEALLIPGRYDRRSNELVSVLETWLTVASGEGYHV